jgi:hypothetical protein
MAAKGLNKRFGQSLDAEIMQLSSKKNSGNTKKSCIITGLIHLEFQKFVSVLETIHGQGRRWISRIINTPRLFTLVL